MTPSHKPWEPYKFQERAASFLTERGAAALFLDPGLGKTAITLEAFRRLQNNGMAEKMLVVAPLRVCQLVWRQEAAKWSQFRHFEFSLLHGAQKENRLNDDADIWLINPEGVMWLSQIHFGRPLPFDTVVLDELTKFKNYNAKRCKSLRPKLQSVERRWGLTGTPTPNGYMDLFGQMKMLDDGAALGKYITHYRDLYSNKGYDGFTYTLRRGADKAIEDRIRPYVLRMSADDYLELPPLINDVRRIKMPAKSLKEYRKLKKDMLLELEDGVVVAANATAVYTKLKQMANGAVYASDDLDDKRKILHLHNAKVEALDELIDELAGQPLLIAYEFRHDLKRLKEHYGADLPYLGSGVTAKQAAQIEQDWNSGKLDKLAVHPASAGHGLNLQLGSASHICWFSATWDYELYDQLIRRLHRQGSEAQHIVNHILTVEDTVDERVLEALRDKKTTQDRLLDALNSEILREAENPDAARYAAKSKQTEKSMVKKLSRKRDIEEAEDAEETEEEDEEETEEEEAPRKPRGFVTEESDDDDDDEDVTEQKKKIRRKITRKSSKSEDEDTDEDEEPPRKKARKKFSKSVREKLDDDDEGDDDEAETKPVKKPVKKAKSRSLKKPAKKETQPSSAPDVGDISITLSGTPEAVAAQMDLLAKALRNG